MDVHCWSPLNVVPRKGIVKIFYFLGSVKTSSEHDHDVRK